MRCRMSFRKYCPFEQCQVKYVDHAVAVHIRRFERHARAGPAVQELLEGDDVEHIELAVR